MVVAKAKPVILRHKSISQIICIKGENKEKPVFLMRSIFGEKTDSDVPLKRTTCDIYDYFHPFVRENGESRKNIHGPAETDVWLMPGEG